MLPCNHLSGMACLTSPLLALLKLRQFGGLRSSLLRSLWHHNCFSLHTVTIIHIENWMANCWPPCWFSNQNSTAKYLDRYLHQLTDDNDQYGLVYRVEFWIEMGHLVEQRMIHGELIGSVWVSPGSSLLNWLDYESRMALFDNLKTHFIITTSDEFSTNQTKSENRVREENYLYKHLSLPVKPWWTL
jgi:hypothetical protein